VTLRLARHEDRPALTALAREAFPRTMQWGLAPGWVVRWYWDGALASDHCEVWLAEGPEGPSGFASLVTDPPAWEHERRTRPGSLRVRAFLLAVRPHVWLEALARRVRGRRSPAPGGLPVGEVGSGAGGRHTWLDWFAVSADRRGAGIGHALFAQLEARTRALGREALRLDVFRGNVRAQAFFLREGCVLDGESRWVKKYAKRVAPAVVPRAEAAAAGAEDEARSHEKDAARKHAEVAR
jgi:ribosomal protein S18 acetylase RimI-like enzyme